VKKHSPHRGTEFTEFGVFFNQKLFTLRPPRLRRCNLLAHFTRKTRDFYVVESQRSIPVRKPNRREIKATPVVNATTIIPMTAALS
jgi:hypothetical protein